MSDNSLIEHDQFYWNQAVAILAGDESGYGCLSGNMYVAWVQYPINFILPKSLFKVNDSKKLSESTRFNLAEQIKTYAKWHIITIDVAAINAGNPYWLRFTESKNYINENKFAINTTVIYDGDRSIDGINLKSEALVKGDSKSFSIASASILAKTAKDSEMIELSKLYPMYNFEDNKGYGTEKHIDAIRKYGLSAVHRIKYCSKYG